MDYMCLLWFLSPVDIAEHSLPPNVLCFVEDPEFGYKDFTRRGEQTPPTFRAQVPCVILWMHAYPHPQQHVKNPMAHANRKVDHLI